MNTNDAVKVLREALTEMVDEYSKFQGTHYWDSDDAEAILAKCANALATPAGSLEYRTCCDHPDCTTCKGRGGFYRLAATNSAATVAKEGGEVPQSNDGKEQDSFEAWASSNRYDMTTHPMFWLFLNERTYAARQGWKAALEYVNANLATPKPEASAATQQAGRAEFIRRVLLSVAEIPDRDSPHDQPEMMLVTSEELRGIITSAFECMDDHAAPISEDTGKPTAADAGGLSLKIEHLEATITELMESRSRLNEKYAELLERHDSMAERGSFEQARDTARILELERQVLADRAARTVTGSGGSIADEIEFAALLNGWMGAGPALDALVAYIDRWAAARNAGVAAPDTSARELTVEQIIELAAKIFGFKAHKAPKEAIDQYAQFARALLAKSKGQTS